MMAGRDPAGGSGAAGRGILLVVVAVAVGAFLLARGFDGSGDAADPAAADSAGEGEPNGAEGSGDGSDNEAEPEVTTPVVTEPPTTLPPPVVTHPPGEVKVAAVNGRGTRGLAGAAVSILDARGYVTAAKNASNVPVVNSVIYYMATYGDDAKAVADALNAPADILAPAPSTVLTLIDNRDNVSDFNIFVVLGTDELIPVSIN